MAQEISDLDFVNSFLKAAADRKMSALVVYGTGTGRTAKIKMTSNVGVSLTRMILDWIRKQPVTAEQLADPMAEEPPSNTEPS